MRSEQERMLRRALADLPLEGLSFDYHKGHVQMHVTYKGKSRMVVVGGSPKDLTHSTTHAKQEVRRFIRSIDR